MDKTNQSQEEIKRKKKRKKKKVVRKHNPLLITICALITLIQIAAGLFLCKEISDMNMIPGKFIAVIVVVVLFMAVVQAVLTAQGTAPSYMLSAMMGLCFASMVSLGVFYVHKTEETLDIITKTKTRTTLDQVSIAVPEDSPYQDIAELKNLRFGVQASLDRSNTDKTMESISQLLGGKMTVDEYDGILDMVDALYEGDDDVIVFNEAYRTLIEDEYEDFSDDVRVLNTYTFASSVVEEEAEEEPSHAGVYAEGDSGLSYLEFDPNRPMDYVEQDPFVLYLSGIDVFGDISTKSRSDVNILAVVNPRTQQILLVTTPRDYYVPLALNNNPMDKLTHAGIYGIDCSIATLENLYNVDINYYLRVNFSGFINIVNALGGVDVVSEQDFTGEAGGYTFKKGKNHVNGKQALCFVRERHSFREGDIMRARNQMAMIHAIVNKATSPTILATYSNLMDSLSTAFMTTMPKHMITEIVKAQLANSYKWNIQTYSTQGTGAKKSTFSIGKKKSWVSMMNEDSVKEASELIQAVLNGDKVELSDPSLEESLEDESVYQVKKETVAVKKTTTAAKKTTKKKKKKK